MEGRPAGFYRRDLLAGLRAVDAELSAAKAELDLR
jgi:hypothetical protein